MTELEKARLLLQNRRSLVKMELYDADDELIDDLSGNVITLSPTISATSDIRRTCSVTLHIADKAQLNQLSERSWYGNTVKLYHGIDDYSTVEWFLLGYYLVSDNSFMYSATTQDVSMTLVDLMASLTEIHGNQIGGTGLVIPAGESIRDAFIAVVTQFTPYRAFDVVEFPDVIPYDLEFDSTSYPYEALVAMLDLFPLYEMYFTADGVFTVKQISAGYDEPVDIPADVMNAVIISENKTNSAKDIKNTTELYGMDINTDHTAITCTTSGDTYTLAFSWPLTTLEAGSTYSFTPDTTNVVAMKIKISDLDPLPLHVREIGGAEPAISAGAIVEGFHYVISYSDSKFFLRGESQIHVIVQEVTEIPDTEEIEAFKTANACNNVKFIVNPDSPFAADVIGMRKQVLKDGEFADIYTTNLAFERAMFENYKKVRLNDTVELEAFLLPSVDVNQKIEYWKPSGFPYDTSTALTIGSGGHLLSPHKPLDDYTDFAVIDGNLTLITNPQYSDSLMSDVEFTMSDGNLVVNYNIQTTTLLVKEVSFDFAAYTMRIQGQKFYPYYPFIEGG